MEDSILNTIKNMLGIDKSCDVYDKDLLVYINSVFSTLYQIGLDDHLPTISEDDYWDDVFSNYMDVLNLIKMYTFVKVRSMFDPPTSSFVLEALNKQAEELEWRVHFQLEGNFEKEQNSNE